MMQALLLVQRRRKRSLNAGADQAKKQFGHARSFEVRQ
jgi:hypothetical protein